MVLMSNLVGKNVYNGGSYAPSKGTNDPQGYVNREINKPVAPASPLRPNGGVQGGVLGNQGIYGGVSNMGDDGESDTRSGIAKSMIRKTMAPSVPKVAPTSAVDTMTALKANLPKIKISPVGKLQLPFNFKYAQGVLSEKRIADAAVLKLQQKRQEEQKAYMNSLMEGAEGYDDTVGDSLNDFASQGTAFSSGYGLKVADDATGYNKFLTDLNTQESDRDINAIANRTNISDTFKSALSKYANQAGYDLDAKAGSFKLKAKPKPKSKKKKK